MSHVLTLMHVSLLFLLVVMPASARAAELDAGDVMKNGGFEAALSDWHGPAGELVATGAAEGEHCLKLTERFVYQQHIPVEGGRRYRISMQIRSEEAAAQAGFVQLSYRGPKVGDGWRGPAQVSLARHSEPALFVTGGTHDWRLFTAVVEAPARAEQLLIYLRHQGGGGAVYYDAVQVEPTEEPATPLDTLQAAKMAPVQPLLRNGGFESGRTGWGGPGGDISRDAPAEGDQSLVLTGRFAFQQSRVDAEQRYRITMKIRSRGAAASEGYVQLSFRGPGVGTGWRGPVKVDLGSRTEPALFVTGGDHDWRTFSAVVEVPKRANQMLMYLRHQGGSGEVFYDAVSLEATDEAVTTAQALRERGMAPAEPMLSDSDFARRSLVNAGFETLPQTGEGAGEATAIAGWLVSGVGGVDTTTAAEGKASLRLIDGHAVAGLRVESGKRYKLAVSIRTEAMAEATASLRVLFRGSGDRQSWGGSAQAVVNRTLRSAAIATGGTHAWQPLTTIVEVPRGMDQMLLYLYKELDDGTAWFDGLTVTPTDAPAVTLADGRDAERLALLPPATDAAAARLAALAAPAEQAATVTLARDGQAAIAIHIASGDDPTELHAAEELATYLGRITGGEFLPLSHDANPRQGPLLVVGRRSSLTAALCPDIDYGALGEDGFVIRAAGPHVVIAGATPRGTLYGVYWLLDRMLGVRWYSPSYTYVPQQATLELSPPRVTQVPRFAYREIFSRDTDAPWYRQHNLLNGASHHRRNLATPAGLKSWSDAWPEGGHNFHRVVNQRKLGKEHGEYFAGGQLAMMHPRVREIAANSLVNTIMRKQKRGQDPSYGFSQEDRGWNADAQSRAFAKAHGGTLAAPLIDMVNSVATSVREAIPEARLATLAYHWSFTPPTDMRVLPYVVMTLAPIHANFAQPFNGPDNAQIARDIAQWAEISDHIIVWDYITNFGNYLQPHPNLEAMGRSIQWLAQFPAVEGYFGQGSYTGRGAEFAELRAWVAARLLWNPELEVVGLIEEFIRGYYGDAASPMLRYRTLMHRAVAETETLLTIRTQATAPYLSWRTMREAEVLMDEAEAAVAHQPGFLRRVRRARLGVDMVILLRRAAFEAASREAGEPWAIDGPARLAAFAHQARMSGVTRIGEGVGSLGALLETMRVERTVPPVPEVAAGAARDAWRDYQDLDLRRYGGATIVADPLASDQGAIRLHGRTGVWGIQLKLDSLPPEGQWNLFVRVRIDPGAGGGSDAGGAGDAAAAQRALSTGVHPADGGSRAVTVGDLPAGAYHTLAIPGGPYRHDPGKSFWLAPPNSRAIEALYVDRLIAVRADGG